MNKEVKIIQKGSVYFFYRPKIEKEEDIQRFFFILKPVNSKKYYLLIVGKKHFPVSEKHESYFLLVDKSSEEVGKLVESLGEKHYSTKTRGERVQPTARCLALGKYLIIEHKGHTHFCYQITNPPTLKKEQTEFNLRSHDDYLINVKNPQKSSLSTNQKKTYPSEIQTKFANRQFISLEDPRFLDLEGVELLLTASTQPDLTERYSDLQTCWEKIPSASLDNEFATLRSPETIAPLK